MGSRLLSWWCGFKSKISSVWPLGWGQMQPSMSFGTLSWYGNYSSFHLPPQSVDTSSLPLQANSLLSSCHSVPRSQQSPDSDGTPSSSHNSAFDTRHPEHCIWRTWFLDFVSIYTIIMSFFLLSKIMDLSQV